jgi:nicotinamidase-related amidase
MDRRAQYRNITCGCQFSLKCLYLQYQPMKAYLLSCVVFVGLASGLQAERLQLNTRKQVESTPGRGDWKVVEKRVEWEPRKTALIICDMWDKHWCKGATERVGEMAPRMNEMVRAARAKGIFIIHAPSDTMKFYEGTPQRQLAQSAPVAKPPVPLQGWCKLDPAKEAPLPIDDSDGGCDDDPPCKSGRAWSRQIATIEIAEGDAITDSTEAYNLLQQRGIDNVIVMGVHANMCVLGRPFSIRQMVGVGKNVLLVRDMTDTMYNSRSRPFVNHFRGTELIVRHIERYWCPSITSADFLGGEPFRFAGEPSKHTAANP